MSEEDFEALLHLKNLLALLLMIAERCTCHGLLLANFLFIIIMYISCYPKLDVVDLVNAVGVV